ncbi:MAG: amylo-alpha-1,6-glucosidase [Erysipelotrichaceae bacterium]|nr:amylo-alpha-1,6-glucosidase [Erysipelotrichaceae bacterium]
MNFKVETARKQSKEPFAFAREIFNQEVNDALFLNYKKENIIACTGLKYNAPVLCHLVTDSRTSSLFNEEKNYFLDFSDGLSINGSAELDSDIKEAIEQIVNRVVNSASTINENGEAIIDLKGYNVGSHYNVNLLLGERSAYADCLQSTPKAVLDHFGRGSFRGKQEKQVLATRYELSPEYNGETANRQFYITENGKQIFYSLDVENNVESAYCVHSQNHTEITYTTKCGLEIKRIIFIVPQMDNMPSAMEAQRVIIKNLKDTPRNLRIVMTGMFGITDPGTLAGDIVYANVVVESELYSINGKPVAITPHHQPKECDKEKRFAAMFVNGETMEEYTSSLMDFVGNSSLDKPEMLARLNNAFSRRQAAFFAMAKSFTLDKETIIDEFVGMSENEDDVREEFDNQLFNLYQTYTNPNNLTKVFETVINSYKDYTLYIEVKTDDKLYDSYINKNLPFQVLYQTYVSRSFAWTQKSYRETGFREIQDIFASMYYMHANKQDALIKRLIASWAENVFELGYAYHNFTSRGKEPGMCSDDQLWLSQAVYRYVTLTGDKDFLKTEIKVAGSNRQRRLIDTLLATIIYSGKISVGKHNLPLLDTADWNDCLRLDKNVIHGPEKEELYFKQLREKNQEFGTALENEQSESVMNACLLKIAADEIAELSKMIGKTEIHTQAKEIADNTKKSVRENAWKENYYARCLINDNRGYDYLGSTKDGLSLDENIDGTYYLNSYSWTLLADIATEEEMTSMLDIIDKYLKTDAGLKLVTAVDYDKLGIFTGSSLYFPGDRENGGVFKHAAMMATVASLKAAKTVKDKNLSKRLKDLAFFMIDKTLPYKTLENPYVLKGNPRFCTQYNNSETGENIGPILSGTASWLSLALYEILGISIEDNKVTLNPIVNIPEFTYRIKDKDRYLTVKINATNNYCLSDTTQITLDGKYVTNGFDISESNDHLIEITL